MFIYSFRAATIKFFGIIAVTLVALIAIIAFVPVYAQGGTGNTQDTPANVQDGVEYTYDKVKTSADAANFLAQFGWTVDGANVKCVTVTIPSEFDKVYEEYNAIQKDEGLNLEKYAGKSVKRFTYTVKNYGADTTVLANLLIYKNKVIGGDISSSDPNGFTHGFTAVG